MRIYVDTSVIGGYFDEEFQAWIHWPSIIIIMKEEKIDAVKMMREIRDKLTKRYLENPELEITDLEKIRRKYKIKHKAKTHAA